MKTLKKSDITKNGAILVGIDPGMVCTAIVQIGQSSQLDNEFQGIPVTVNSFKNDIYGALRYLDRLTEYTTPESIFVVEDSRKRSGKKEAAYGAGCVNTVTLAIEQILEDREVNFILRKAGGRGNPKLSKELIYEAYGVKLKNEHEADAFMCAIREVTII